jgi:O-antigen ligase
MTPVLAIAGIALANTLPRLLLTVMVVLDVTNLNAVIADHTGVSLYRPLLFLAVVALLVLARQRRLVLRGSPVVVTLMLLLGCVWVNAVFSTIPATSNQAAFTLTTDMFYFLVVYVLLCSLRSWAEVMAAATVGLAVLAAVTVGHELLLGGSGDVFGLSRRVLVEQGTDLIPRYAGPMEDVNFWGRLLLLFLPVALSFAALAGRRGSYARLGGWAVAAVSLVAGIYLTDSRGAFLALPVGLFAWMLLAGRRTRRTLLWLPLPLFLMIVVSGAGDRLSSLNQLFSGGTLSSGDASLTNRLRLMQDAGRMFLASPWMGQGVGTYQDRVGLFDRYANTSAPLEVAGAAHNFFLEQAADGGVVLLIAWVLVGGAVVVACRRSLRLLGVTQVSDRYVVVGGASGLAGWLAASMFLHMSNFRALLVVLAVLAAIEQEARRTGTGVMGARPAAARLRRAVAGGLVAASAALVVAGGVGLLANGWTTSWRSTAVLAIGVEDAQGDYAAYYLELISRGLVAPTFAEVLQRQYDAGYSAEGRATFLASPEGGAIVVEVIADTEADAQASAADTVTWARSQVAGLETPYVLRSGAGVSEVGGTMAWRDWLLLALGAGLGLVSAVLYRRAWRAEGSAVAVGTGSGGSGPVPVGEHAQA